MTERYAHHMKGRVKREIEVKLRVKDAAEMRRHLRRLGGRVERCVLERNTLFDTSKATLRKQGRLLRLREEREQLGKRLTRFVVTMKGPGQDGRRKRLTSGHSASRVDRDVSYRGARYKVREEMEFVIADPRAFLALAGQEGLRPSFRYEKYRTSYRVPRAGAHLELDETPAGVFLELEGFPRAIDRLARGLGYGPSEYITRSYAALHFEECRRRGVRAGDMMFTSRKK